MDVCRFLFILVPKLILWILKAPSMSVDIAMDVLLEELMDLHASNSQFRDLFKLQEPTEIMLHALKSFMNTIIGKPTLTTSSSRVTRVFEKCSVLAGMMAHTLGVPATQRDEVGI